MITLSEAERERLYRHFAGTEGNLQPHNLLKAECSAHHLLPYSQRTNPILTLHGVDHAIRVIENINKILDMCKNEGTVFNSIEIELLYTSAWLHDIGYIMIGMNDEKEDRKHCDESCRLIKKYDLASATNEFLYPLEKIIKSHGYGTGNVPEKVKVDGKEIKLKKLCSILCLADMCDINEMRAHNVIYQILGEEKILDEDITAKKHWIATRLVNIDINVEGKEIIVGYENEALCKILLDCIKRYMPGHVETVFGKDAVRCRIEEITFGYTDEEILSDIHKRSKFDFLINAVMRFISDKIVQLNADTVITINKKGRKIFSEIKSRDPFSFRKCTVKTNNDFTEEDTDGKKVIIFDDSIGEGTTVRETIEKIKGTPKEIYVVAIFANKIAISNISHAFPQKSILFETMKLYESYRKQNDECAVELLTLTAWVKDKTGTGYLITSYSVKADRTVPEVGEVIRQKMSDVFGTAETTAEEPNEESYTFTLHFFDIPDLDEYNPQKIRFFVFREGDEIKIKFVTIISPRYDSATSGPEDAAWRNSLEAIQKEYSERTSKSLSDALLSKGIKISDGPMPDRPSE